VIHVIGLGVEQPVRFSPAAEQALATAQGVIGSERQLALLPLAVEPERRVRLPKLAQLPERLQSHEQGDWVVLASGDPLHYGIGAFLSRHFPRQALHFYPALSSMQAFAHQLQLSQQEFEVVSLHGRPLSSLRRHLKRKRKVMILSDQQSQPQHLAQLCQHTGFAASRLWVSEMIGYPQQRLRCFSVAELLERPFEFESLHLSLIEVAGEGGVLPEFPGIEDQHFVTDGERGQGLLTKREVRLAILSLLQPASGEVGWDIGAGCGGVAVEWALWNRGGSVLAIEHHPERLDALAQNRIQFGVEENLEVVEGFAPEALAGLSRPDKVFIGGSGGQLLEILQQVWVRLRDGGVLVVSAVTEESRLALLQFGLSMPEVESESMQISVARRGTLAGQNLYRPQLPVTLFKWLKS